MRTVPTALFSLALCASHASAQVPIYTARGRTIDVGLSYAYVTRGENFSNRVGLQGADVSFTVGSSRLAVQADVGYALASNVYGTQHHSDVVTYLVGTVFYPKTHRNFDLYVHALAGGARVSGPVPVAGGGFLLGGWATNFAWAGGGGVDYWITEHMAIRTGADFMRTSYYDPTLALRGQTNLRATAGIVYFFGQHSRTRR